MTKTEFRNHFTELLEKADKINGNICGNPKAKKVYIGLSSLPSIYTEAGNLDVISIRIVVGEKDIYRNRSQSTSVYADKRIKEMNQKLDSIIKGLGGR